MLRAMSLSLCLILPTASFAQDPSAPVLQQPADQPTQPTAADPSLTPNADPGAANASQQPQPAVENARWCGAHGGCGGGRGKGKWIVLTGVAGTVITAVAVGVAVGLATRGPSQPQTP